MSPRTAREVATTVFLAALASAAAIAQISPGELSASHAQLEGSTRCLECHAPRRGVEAERCLACHAVLGERIGRAEGLHSRAEYEECASCHIEHQGKAFELVWWGDEGIAAFDHQLTGYPLAGAHREAECRACHRSDLLMGDVERLDREADLERTFLGLAGQTCAGCHADPHRGEFAGRGCSDCHTESTWRPAAGFDHALARYPLTGAHRDVACERCHRPLASGEETLPLFRGLAFGRCTDCHQDPHLHRLGATCTECHDTASWSRTASEGFDHTRTRFPLRGAHRPLACTACHPGGDTLRPLAFAACSDCHLDEHRGQLADRPDGGRCDACHDENTFRPARFGLEQHQATGYPLEGSHLAVPCSACHQRVAAASLPGASGRFSGPGDTVQLRFASTRCEACHEDVHRGEAARWIEEGDCLACHSLDGWRTATFDHDLSRLPLEGRHTELPCRDCHRPRGESEQLWRGPDALRLTGLPLGCAGCHLDPHRAQFARSDGTTDCRSCHGSVRFEPASFDHGATRFPLDGAHRQVACVKCHPIEPIDGEPASRYRPTPLACADCHAGEPVGF